MDKNKKIIIAAVSALIVIIAAVAVICGVSAKNKKDSNNETTVSETVSSSENTTKENFSEAPEETTKTSTEAADITTEPINPDEIPGADLLSAAEKESLGKMLEGAMKFAYSRFTPNPIYYFYNFDARKSEIKALEMLTDNETGIMTDLISIYGWNGVYYDRKNTSEADPLKKYGKDGKYTYRVFDGDKVDYVIRNIFNTEPNHDHQLYKKEQYFVYYYGGKYYTSIGSNDIEKVKVNFTNITQNADGKYVINYTFLMGDKALKDVSYHTVTAEIKELDGKKLWSIYSIETLYAFE